jgi:hypothetical protein
MGVDSLLGKLSEETNTAEDTPLRQFAAEQGQIARHIKVLSSLVLRRPWLVVTIQHNKPKPHPSGFGQVDHTPGGKEIDFVDSLRLRIQVTEIIKSAKVMGKRLKLMPTKNSQGPEGRHLTTRILWEPNEEGLAKNRAVFDWPWSDITTLLEMDPSDRKAWEEFLHIESLRKSSLTNSCWSKTLGVPKTDPVSYREMGIRLAAAKDIRKQLRNAYGIQQVAPFKIGECYLKQCFEVERTLIHAQEAMGSDSEVEPPPEK